LLFLSLFLTHQNTDTTGILPMAYIIASKVSIGTCGDQIHDFSLVSGESELTCIIYGEKIPLRRWIARHLLENGTNFSFQWRTTCPKRKIIRPVTGYRCNITVILFLLCVYSYSSRHSTGTTFYL